MEISSEVDKLVVLDDFTSRYRKAGFVRIRVELDSLEPLKLGVSIRMEDGVIWQTFVYENIPSICYGCGWLGHTVDECSRGREEARSMGKRLQPENFCTSLMVVEGGNLEKGERVLSERPRLGSWVTTSWIRQPRPSRVLASLKKEVGSKSNSSDQSSSPSQPSSLVPGNSSLGSSPDSDKW